jgi:hypothetical protein
LIIAIGRVIMASSPRSAERHSKGDLAQNDDSKGPYRIGQVEQASVDRRDGEAVKVQGWGGIGEAFSLEHNERLMWYFEL